VNPKQRINLSCLSRSQKVQASNAFPKGYWESSSTDSFIRCHEPKEAIVAVVLRPPELGAEGLKSELRAFGLLAWDDLIIEVVSLVIVFSKTSFKHF